jgi:hypothetical protein
LEITFTHRKVREKLPGRGGLMKVNIYEEELTERIEIRKKESGDRQLNAE